MNQNWNFDPGPQESRRKTLWFSIGLGAIIMIFLFTVLPLLKVLVTAPEMPESFREVIVDIVKAREKEKPQPEEEQQEEEEAPQEEAPQRRETTRRSETRDRTREVRTRPETQELALEQEVELNLQRQRSQRQDMRRDRDVGQRQTQRRSASDITVPKTEASLETGGGSDRASLGRDRSGRDRTGSGGRSRRSTGSARLEVGEGPTSVSVPSEPQQASGGSVQDDVTPIIEWLKANERAIPRDLMEPEYFNYQAGDLTSQVTFTASDGTEYTIYLLGREGDPPELKMFIVTGRDGVLLTDIGAKGQRSESFQAGRVLVRGDRMSLQMSQISPGDPRASESMDIFLDWWNSQ